MLISDNKKEFYDQILKNRSHVLILVNHDLDSIVSSKIIRYIFECDHIPYTIVPIRTKQDLLRSYQEHRNNIRFLLLINLGATLNLNELLLIENDLQIFVADCHRPLEVNNVYVAQDIHIMCAISNIHNIENEFDKIPPYKYLFWDEDVEPDDGTDVRQLSLEQLRIRDKFKKFEYKREKILYKYLERAYYSYSTSLIFFDLAWKLGKDSNELLWLVILAVVDKLNMYKLPNNLVKKEISYLSDSMYRLKNICSNHGFVLNPIRNVDDDDPQLITTTNHLSITYEKDLNLKLYRVWSLYDSLRHTIYTSCGFQIWKLKGNRRMHSFLAEIGLPLIQCKQKFQSMDLDLRRKLIEEFEDKKAKYNLQSLICHSFIGSRGSKQKFSASDLAMASRALLESSDRDRSFNQKFFDAYDSLSWNNQGLIQTGIALAKAQLTAIVKQVQIIIDAHLISLLNNVLYYVIIPETTPDANLFCHPGCLKLLGIYTLSAFGSFSKTKKSQGLPLILVTPDPEREGGALVCGVAPIVAIKDCRTFFCQAFKKISERMNSISENWNYEESMIDSDIAYITYNDAHTFLNELSYTLESN